MSINNKKEMFIDSERKYVKNNIFILIKGILWK